MALSKQVKHRIRLNRARRNSRHSFGKMYRALPEAEKAKFPSVKDFIRHTLLPMTIGYNTAAAQRDTSDEMIFPTVIVGGGDGTQ
jgi:hypothetical protein